MTDKFTTFQQALLQNYSFSIQYKNQSWFMKLISYILFFLPTFMTDYITTIGGTIYYPSQAFIANDEDDAMIVLTYSSLKSTSATYTFNAVVSIPTGSTAKVIVYDKTNATALYTSSIISGLQVEYTFTSVITPASGSSMLEFWFSTPTNTGGNATCYSAGILIT